MRFNTLSDWLCWLETGIDNRIDLRLERVAAVWRRLGEPRPAPKVITVAGTNGKGSCVAMLEAIYLAAGYRVGVYTSPELIRYNERVCLNGEEAADALFCTAFQKIDDARLDGEEIRLTRFEFDTLAAIVLLAEAGLDVAVLEVGLGGRLDAVNIIDADVALITSIALDHADWLGNDRETIGREKAGIMRSGRAAVCGDAEAPQSISQVAAEVGAELYLIGRDFDFVDQQSQWQWQSGDTCRNALPMPSLLGRFQMANAAAVLKVVELLQTALPVAQNAVRGGLGQIRLAGRFQIIQTDKEQPPWVLDVAHNPQAAQGLAANLKAWPMPGKTCAVAAMMADKDIEAVFDALLPEVDEWHVAAFDDNPRAAAVERLSGALAQRGAAGHAHASVEAALAQICDSRAYREGEYGRIVIFGSFFTVAAALQFIMAQR